MKCGVSGKKLLTNKRYKHTRARLNEQEIVEMSMGKKNNKKTNIPGTNC